MPEQTTPTEDPAATEPAQPGAEAEPEAASPDPAPGDDAAGETHPQDVPEYKGEPLDAERGPGLGCFWIQVGLLTFFLILTPLTVTWGWDPTVSAFLLILTLVLLLFSGQTIIFLLRLVAADRRTRRAPLDPAAKPTVGQMEDVGTSASEGARASDTPTAAAPATQATPLQPGDDDD